jgi:hypothetical protein
MGRGGNRRCNDKARGNGPATFFETITGGDDSPDVSPEVGSSGGEISVNLASYSVDIRGATSDTLVIGSALDLSHPLLRGGLIRVNRPAADSR